MNLPQREKTASGGEKGRYKDDLDEHVEHVLGKKDKIRRIGRGVRDFVSTRE